MNFKYYDKDKISKMVEFQIRGPVLILVFLNEVENHSFISQCILSRLSFYRTQLPCAMDADELT